MSTNNTFSTSGEDAITRAIDLGEDKALAEVPPEEFEEYYDIERTVHEIHRGDYKRIALQFPDELLRDSVPIFRRLKAKLGEGRELYVLADTSYGSCCVDEVAAQHVEADVMVHYGHACMSQTSRLPVIYVFGKKDVNAFDCVDSFTRIMAASDSPNGRETVMLRLDVAYAHRADAILARLKAVLPSSTRILYSQIPLKILPTGKRSESRECDDEQAVADSQCHDKTPSEHCTIFYVGDESLSLTNLLMTHASCTVHSYNPKTRFTRLESTRTNKLLMRRYAVVQKARDADVFGILVGTLGVASYIPLISYLRKMLSNAHKKSYTISVGKLSPAKLANFLEIECFVLVACPENSLIVAKDFLRPIITPYELEVALRAEQSWTGRYVLDFDQVLVNYRKDQEGERFSASFGRNADSHLNDAVPRAEHEDLDGPVFSLVTGKYRHAKHYGASESTDRRTGESSAVILRNQDSTVASLPDSAGGQFLQSRTFRGLETRIGQDAPGILEQGRSGVARGYADDHRAQ